MLFVIMKRVREMSKFEINNVVDTALWVAAFRAIESKRPDALFNDPFAEKLVGLNSHKIIRNMKGSTYTSWLVIIRTCIIDRYILNLIKSGVDTIINLGAGLDTRPYRLNLPTSLHWIEVDFPEMINYKNQFLQNETPKCKLERISLDLTNYEKRNKLFSQINAESKKTLVLTEGVITYLENQEVANLCHDLRKNNTFKYWIVDYFSPIFLNEIRKKNYTKQMKNAPIQFYPKDWFSFFNENNWEVNEITFLDEESKKLNRKMPSPFWLKLIKKIIPTSKQLIFQKFAAYVVLIPSGHE